MKRTLVYGLSTVLLLASSMLTVSQAATAKKGPGTCGENMFWSAKDHTCHDARIKSSGSWYPF